MKQLLFSLLTTALLFGCHKEQITIATSAHDVFYLTNNNASMPIRVHGNTASKVFLMMIHGGPGDDAIAYRTDYVINHLETELAMVYWDQRNSGASQGGSNDSFDDIGYFVDDMEKVITLLKSRYGADISIFVNGHSWGGFLAPSYLQKGHNQYAVKGWIQTAGAHNIPLLNEYAVEMLLNKAEIEIAANNNTTQWQEIQDYCKNLSFPLTIEQGRQVNIYATIAARLTPELPGVIYAPGEILGNYVENDAPLLQIFFPFKPLPASLANWLFAGRQVSDNMNKITIPTLLLFGKYDYTCPAKLADDIESRVQSTFKKKVIFEKSGHSMMAGVDEQAYWDEIISFVNEFK